jgi:hypothetical protein
MNRNPSRMAAQISGPYGPRTFSNDKLIFVISWQ